MWEHETRRTKLCLCVDDFGIKSFSDADTNHLLDSLKQHYTVTVDHQGTNFCGLNIDWNYKEGYVDISIPHYIRDLSKKLLHVMSKHLQYSPHAYTPFKFEKKGVQQFVSTSDTTPLLGTKDIKYVQ